eukprot:CAMPEP_0175099180 /NCGR_PEP_ID=MMETSP0086_2-20121207/6298_1 /TAXON_ID=136419 /ORGANISM="Unknown Unknown, Strain D1" /LENGTH=543 /DNA_ID=CAMNT_0016372971 /DNA_START=59 /DNA_END=1690 /DNA_ORIENTATION=-
MSFSGDEEASDSLLGRAAHRWFGDSSDGGYDTHSEIAMKGGHEQINAKIGPVWATVHMLKAFIGTAILALPFSFKLAGFLGGFALLVIISAAVAIGMVWVIEAKHIVEKMVRDEDMSVSDNAEMQDPIPEWRRQALAKLRLSGRDLTFGDLASVAMGKLGSFLTDFCLVSLQFGILVVYIIFIGKNFANVLCKFSDSEFCWGTSSLDLNRHVHAGHSAEFYSHAPFRLVAAVATLSCVPLFLLSNLKKLRFASLAAIIATAYAVVYVLVIQAKILVYEEQHQVTPTMNLGGPFSNVLLVLGILVYAMEGVGLAIPIESSLQNRAHYPKIALLTVLITASLYLPIGILGYMAFAGHTSDIVLLNFPPSHWTSVLQVTLCVSLIFTAPLQGLPAFQITERAIFGFSPADQNANGEEKTFVPWQHALYRIFVVSLLGLTAMYLPFFHVVIGLLGSFCCSCLAITFPAFFVFALGKDHSGLKKFLLICMISFGLFICVAGTGAIFFSEVIHSNKVHAHALQPGSPLHKALQSASNKLSMLVSNLQSK